MKFSYCFVEAHSVPVTSANPELLFPKARTRLKCQAPNCNVNSRTADVSCQCTDGRRNCHWACWFQSHRWFITYLCGFLAKTSQAFGSQCVPLIALEIDSWRKNDHDQFQSWKIRFWIVKKATLRKPNSCTTISRFVHPDPSMSTIFSISEFRNSFTFCIF